MATLHIISAGVFVLLLSACQDAEKCTSWSGAGAGASWSSCGDKKERKIQCTANDWKNIGPGAPAKCTCTLDGIVGKSFETTDPVKFGSKDTAVSIANEQCGWHLQ